MKKQKVRIEQGEVIKTVIYVLNRILKSNSKTYHRKFLIIKH